jgi:hypothetical protein
MDKIAVNVLALEIKETQMSPELMRLHKNADALLARLNQRKSKVALATKQTDADARSMAWLLNLSPKEAEHVALHAADGADYFLKPQKVAEGMTLPNGKGGGLGDTPGNERRQASDMTPPMHFKSHDAVSDVTPMADIIFQLGITPEEFAAQRKLNAAK